MERVDIIKGCNSREIRDCTIPHSTPFAGTACENSLEIGQVGRLVSLSSYLFLYEKKSERRLCRSSLLNDDCKIFLNCYCCSGNDNTFVGI